MSVRTRNIRRIAGLSACALVLSGCFANTGAGGRDEGRLGVALAFQPAADMSPYSDDAILLSKIGTTETLTVLDREGNPQPGLAEDWEQTSPDTLRMTLRPGASFHDGTPATAEHAAAALQHAAEATTPPRSLQGVQLRARAAGERTLEVSTDRPDPILAQRLSAPELAILSPAAYREDSDSPDPVRAGTGPYVLDEVHGSSGAALSANREYWGGPPQATGVDVRFIADSATRTNALRAGEVDIVDNVPVPQLPALGEHEVLDFPLPRLVGAHLNTQRGPFTDPGLRAAAREAVDARAITESLYAGSADPARGLFGPASPWAGSDPQHSTEPGTPRGEPIRIATYDERPELPEAASVVAEKLRAAGFRVEDVVVQEYSTMESDLLDGAYDVVIGTRSYGVDTGDPISYLSTDWTCDGSYNLSLLCDPGIDRAVQDAAGADVDQRKREAVRIADRVVGTDAVLPLAHERTRIGTAPQVHGVAEDSFDRRLITAETGGDA
ncbi:ABC transporter substrate-binding protein [Saccharopolyspora sp. HNM0983]|uniref:ABC transporter substrate-binding protein n=1 Tax=Saccharopolyspora montiporae TaxID=2781240 RepID=A0A929FWN0_9PSEU|nr:ABC transporter substrate-binding protein [Saccharopolyspora sp. HNM0983]MBE9373716.1 ABC transporter substrate-binding protein [Saccharopolyspora sp. HNM0983]